MTLATPSDIEASAQVRELIELRLIGDDVVFLEEIPKTSVGKFSKKELRAKFEDYKLPTA